MTTKATMALAELSEKGADVDLLREMIRHVAQRMMDMEVESLCAAGYGERSPERVNSRNGYRERQWDTRSGTIAADPQAAQRQLLPRFSGTAPHGGEGARRGDPGGFL